MAFEERLTASVRGVEFLLSNVGGKGGRRAIPREYPKREVGWTEDNGAVLTNEQVQAKVVGKDYLDQLRALLTALNQPGPCEMVHPWWGVRTVQVGAVEHQLDNDEDGIAYVNFSVYEAGSNLFPAQAIDSADALGSAADKAQAASEQSFLDKFVTGLDNMGEMVDTLLDDLDEFTNGLPAMPSQLRDWTDRLMRTKDSVGKLLAYPGELARGVMGCVEDLRGVVADPIRSLQVYDSLARRWSGLRAELAITGGLPRSIKSDASTGTASAVSLIETDGELQSSLANGAAFSQLIARSAAVASASALAEADLSPARNLTADLGDTVTIGQSLVGDMAEHQLSRPIVLDGVLLTGQPLQLTADDLERMGAQLAAWLAELAAEAVEAGESDVWRTLRDLRLAVLADVRDRGGRLPQRRNVSVRTTTPVALLAWQQYGNAEYRDRLVAGNRLANPAFIIPSQTVVVIDDV